MIKQLEEKTIALTGATGFLGTALLEAILAATDSTKVICLIRSTSRYSPEERLRKEILNNDAFNPLKEKFKESFDQKIASRVTAINGDVSVDGLNINSDELEKLKEASVFIHSAATVEFDSPFDVAAEINLLGPYRFAQTIKEIKKDNLKDVHFISVSTAYVSSFKKGRADEQSLKSHIKELSIDFINEVNQARALRKDIELASRLPKMLAKFHTEAAKELGGAGRKLLAKKTEELRTDWVKQEMIKAGRARSQALGWPDVYAYTKSLGEVALEETGLDVTIIRPSIIECALKSPFPGWIRGFRMADPIIISFARGLLKEFPGIPEGIIDVIPVDLVVNLILEVILNGYDPERPIYHICSGSRNPLKYRELVDLTKVYFAQNPLYDSKGQPIALPDWSYPGRHEVQRQLQRMLKTLNIIRDVSLHLPLRGKSTEYFLDLEEKRSLIKRAQNYAELYGSYTETEAVFDLSNTMSLKENGNNFFDFDPNQISWAHYLHDIYLPSVVRHARVSTKPKKPNQNKTKKQLDAIFSSNRQLAVFDLENTIMSSNVVITYAWLASSKLDWQQKTELALKLILKAPTLLSLDRRDRGDFLRFFYRNFKDANPNELTDLSKELVASYLLNKTYPSAISFIRKHKQLGHKTILITGAISQIVEPLRPLFDDVISAEITQESGRLSGELLTVPPTGEVRACLLENYCKQRSIELSQCVAYGDSISDLSLLDMVGYPVVVNPDLKLASIARKKGWPILYWQTPKGPIKTLPLAKSPKTSKQSQLAQTSLKIIQAIKSRI
jgi:fatty acyl-CoA reductase